MINLILNAIPFFLLSIVIEFFVLRRAAADDHGDPADGPSATSSRTREPA